jgi:hypothetical protein
MEYPSLLSKIFQDFDNQMVGGAPRGVNQGEGAAVLSGGAWVTISFPLRRAAQAD